MYPNFPNQPPRNLGYSSRPPMNPGYQSQRPMNPGYQDQWQMNFEYPNQPPRNLGNSSRPPMNPGYPSQYSMIVPRIRPQTQRIARPLPRQYTEASCEACYDMNPRFRPAQKHTTLGPNEIKVYLPDFLEASENSQCPFCTVLLNIFLANVENAEEKASRAVQQSGRPPGLPCASVFIESGKPVEIHFSEGMHAKAVSYSPILLYNPTDKVLPNWPDLSALEDPEQELDGSFQFFKDQIDNCVKNHPRCAQTSRRDLPKRLLDLGARDSDVVKLVDSDSLGSSDRKYAAVSHRWCGKSVPMLQTTKKSKDDHYSLGICEEDMPAVLLDAIRVTRTLGLRYLWMDTLCLIQDDKTDKEKELPQMGTYYANAYFTISASSSADSMESFLKPRDELYNPAQLQFGEDENSFVHFRRWGAEGHLANRGWIWQESALSTRVLNFAPSELIWECKSQVISECGYELRNTPSLGLARRFHDIQQRPLEFWRELVQSYSARDLTRYTDVLPAISGLAQRVKDLTDSEYFAGIWEDDIACGLLWEAARDFMEARPKVPAEYTAPSWSWASVQGRVRISDTAMGNSSMAAGYRGPGGPIPVDRSFAALTPVIQIDKVECAVPSKRQNCFGAVTGGSIELTGRLISVALSCAYKVTTGRTYMLEHPGKPNTSIRFSADTELAPFMVRHGRSELWSAKRSNNPSGAAFRVPVECLLIAEGPGATARDVTLNGIVLGRSQIDPNQRRRIGFFSFSDASWFAGAGRDQTVTIV